MPAGQRDDLAVSQDDQAGPGVGWGNLLDAEKAVTRAEDAVAAQPLEQMRQVWERQGWTGVPFASSRGTTFSVDCGAGDGFLLSVFLRDGDEVYRTYTTSQRGVDRLVFANSIRDLLPYGRQEEWEDSPPGWPQHRTWWVQDQAPPVLEQLVTEPTTGD